MLYQIEPMGKPRMTQRDKWGEREVVQRYWAFKDECQLRKVEVPEEGAEVTFILPMPKSWSQKKKAEFDGKPHQQNPDIDNLLKALLDAVYKDDSKVWEIKARKIWGYLGAINIC